MATATMEREKAVRTVKTGNVILDMEIPLLSDGQLEKLADYAKDRRWSGEDDNDDWADAPLTPEEEEGLRLGRENAKKGDYLTLAEFRESRKSE
ncbi:MAG: hypothetical protein IJU07_03510 [Synergistaceae bacterium]|nr:hypothetical protein [Synergistaceae bacterium]